MLEQQIGQNETNLVYKQSLSTEELKKKVLDRDPVDAAMTMVERAAQIEQSYKSIDNNYSGLIGTLRKYFDIAGITSFEQRLNIRVSRASKTLRALESIVEVGVRESSSASRKLSEVETKQCYAYALMGRYESMISELDQKIEEKKQQYDQMIRIASNNPEGFGYETVAEEINNLRVDRASLKDEYDESAVVVMECESQQSYLNSRKAIVDAQVNKARTAALKGRIGVNGLKVHTDKTTSPYKVASAIQSQERQTQEISRLSEQLGELVEETIGVYKGLDISAIEDNISSARTARLRKGVEEERDIWGAKAKEIMEAKRLAS